MTAPILKHDPGEGPGRKPRSLLPSPPPGEAAPAGEHIAWLTVVLGQGADPIERVDRYGRSPDARMVAVLRSGRRITFPRQADAFDARKLRQTVKIATRARFPHYGPGDAEVIAGAFLDAADVLDQTDDRAEASEWAATFLDAARPNTVELPAMATAAGKYAALRGLADWQVPSHVEPYAPPAERSVIGQTADGTRLVRTGDFARHVRALTGTSIAWATLHSRMTEIGWEHRGKVQQRQPGGHGRVGVHIYAIPAGWDAQ